LHGEIRNDTKTTRPRLAVLGFRRGAGACALFASRASSRGCARCRASRLFPWYDAAFFLRFGVDDRLDGALPDLFY
jgi:hypothetical protein